MIMVRVDVVRKSDLTGSPLQPESGTTAGKTATKGEPEAGLATGPRLNKKKGEVKLDWKTESQLRHELEEVWALYEAEKEFTKKLSQKINLMLDVLELVKDHSHGPTRDKIYRIIFEVMSE